MDSVAQLRKRQPLIRQQLDDDGRHDFEELLGQIEKLLGDMPVPDGLGVSSLIEEAEAISARVVPAKENRCAGLAD